MQRLAYALLVAGGAATGCGGVETDDRPLELQYLTQAIFAPTCGATQCHSTFRQAKNVVFDTPEAARATLVNHGLISFDSEEYDPEAPERAPLIQWITEIDPFGKGIGRMPFDAPMPDANVKLLIEWIRAPQPGVSGGLAYGAQCDPGANADTAQAGLACNKNEIVRCTDDWNFGDRVIACMKGCTGDARCQCERTCANGCSDDGKSCTCPQTCVNGCNGDGTCTCPQTCVNGCNGDGTCK